MQEANPAAVRRLLAATDATKTNFLDRKFLRRQKHSSNLRLSAFGTSTWTRGWPAAPLARHKRRRQRRGPGTARPALQSPRRRRSDRVPADDEQPCCALSGERFEQYWAEEHQEWRYRDAKRLDADEAAAHGLAQGALVLVTALGPPRAAEEPAAAEPGSSTSPAKLGAEADGVKSEEAGVKEEVKAEEVEAEAAAEEAAPEEAAPAAKRVKLELQLQP